MMCHSVQVLMKLALLWLMSLHMARGQQAGTLEAEGNPVMTFKECTVSGGCTSKSAKLVLDANWRWIHSTSGSQNCYTGNQWDTSLCPNNEACAQNCALEGVSANKYQDTYGISEVQDGVKIQFVTNHQYGSNVGGRLYMLDDDGESYKMFYLKNREFSIEVDVSELYCGMNGAMYFVEMDEYGGGNLPGNNAGAKYGTGYCDAQCPHDIKFIDGAANVEEWVPNPKDFSNNMGMGKYGSCCAEMDIWEANSMATAYTPHNCEVPGQYRCEGIACGDTDKGERYDGVCDKDGCDINPFRMGNQSFYGRGAEFAVNTLRPMTVVTQFLTTDGTDDGDLSEIRRFYVQDGRVVHSPPAIILSGAQDSITDDFCVEKKVLFGDVNDYQQNGGNAEMGNSLDRGHVMVLSLWDDVEVNMLWLDSKYPVEESADTPGVLRGLCPGGDESTPQYLRATYPTSAVTFKNAAVGEIGSTVGPDALTTLAPGATTTSTPQQGGCAGPCSEVWGQCGGNNWNGPTCCVSGSGCVFNNEWYSQCLPGAPNECDNIPMTTTTLPTTTTTTTPTTTTLSTSTTTTTTTTTTSTTTTTTTTTTSTTTTTAATTTTTTAATTTATAATTTTTAVTTTTTAATTTTATTATTTTATTASVTTTTATTTTTPATSTTTFGLGSCYAACTLVNNTHAGEGCDRWNGQEASCEQSFITHRDGDVVVPCKWTACDSSCRAAGSALMLCPASSYACI